ncbi:hypothetical protein PUR49_07960 [Streptomyces sp. BE147]|uniref:hypothetical protein n=1 Tax=Streptomyces sp. BE147 TaxID=3002524 RepID=UPI002E78EBF4|nr:hypothetical protein [Streptomyces sp. BE147]MEE1736433.1 hypothetical protein [Streptomyces sp. BE147]
MKADEQLNVARIALATSGSRGYTLAGSLALREHRVAGARDSDDVDLFVNQPLDDADTVRDNVAQALRGAGYHVEQAATWGVTPDAAPPQNGEFLVTHPDHGTVTVQMICNIRYLKPADRNGMPLNAIGQCLYDKMAALQNRLQAKDFIDLSLLQAHMGQTNADRYVGMYVTGLAQYQGRPEAALQLDLYQSFVQVAQIPDEAFAAYGYTPAQAVQLRTTVLTWADRLAPESNPMLRDTAIASGHLPITYLDAQDALNRMAHSPSMTRLSDQQISSWRAEVTWTLLHAISTRQSTWQAQQQLHPISGELKRRAQLTPHERAAEDAVRRAEEAELMAGGDPGRLGPLGVLVRLKPPSPQAVPPTTDTVGGVPLYQQHAQAQAQQDTRPGRQT